MQEESFQSMAVQFGYPVVQVRVAIGKSCQAKRAVRNALFQDKRACEFSQNWIRLRDPI